MSDDLGPLDELARANTPQELREAHRSVARAIAKKRRKEAAELGPLAQTYGEAIRQWDDQKAAGASLEERQRNFERTLRVAWPFTREWKFLCERCSDSGWAFKTCTPETPCGRPFKFPNQRSDDYTGQGKCTPNHRYVAACWCEKGQAFRRQLEGQRRPEDFTQATKGKARDFSKVGR